MKNILLILPYGGVGGMERVALNFYYYYKSKGYNVKAIKLIGLDSDIIKFNEDEYVFSNKDLNQRSPIQRLLFYILAPFKLRKIIKTNNIELQAKKNPLISINIITNFILEQVLATNN